MMRLSVYTLWIFKQGFQVLHIERVVQELPHLFADFSPGLLQTVDSTSIECGCDLQYSVVVVQTATYVCHSNPLLNGVGP